MSKILSNGIISALLKEHYESKYGVRAEDLFYEQPA